MAPSGLNLDSLVIRIDGEDVTTNFYRFGRGAVGNGSNLVAGSHTWSATIADYAGNVTTVSNTFIAIGAVNTDAPVDGDNYYWEEGWAGSELVQVPLHYPPGTLVLFTFGGVDYGPRPPGVPRDMSQVSWKGLAPVAWNNGDGINLGTVSYLLTVTGGDYLEVNPADFSWPGGNWSATGTTPCGGVSETQVFGAWLKFDGFWNCAPIRITGPKRVLIGQTITLSVSCITSGTLWWKGTTNLSVEGVADQQTVTLRAGALGRWEKIELDWTDLWGHVHKFYRLVKVQRPTSDAIVKGLGVDSTIVSGSFPSGLPIVMQVDVAWEVRDQEGEPVRTASGLPVEECVQREGYTNCTWEALPFPLDQNASTVDPKLLVILDQSVLDAWNNASTGQLVGWFQQTNRMVIKVKGQDVICKFVCRIFVNRKTSSQSWQLQEY